MHLKKNKICTFHYTLATLIYEIFCTNDVSIRASLKHGFRISDYCIYSIYSLYTPRHRDNPGSKYNERKYLIQSKTMRSFNFHWDTPIVKGKKNRFDTRFLAIFNQILSEQ